MDARYNSYEGELRQLEIKNTVKEIDRRLSWIEEKVGDIVFLLESYGPDWKEMSRGRH